MWTDENNQQLAMALRTWGGNVYTLYEHAKKIDLKYRFNVEADKEASLMDAQAMTADDMRETLGLVRALIELVEDGTPISANVGPIIARALRNVGV